MSRQTPFEDLHSIGEFIGPYKVKFLGYSHNVENRRYYLFECPQCKQSFSTRCNRITRGTSYTCGTKCPQRPKAFGKDRLYKVHAEMKQRCGNPNDCSYKNYGARGIMVTPLWYNYQPFKEWALANNYQQGLTLERIDVNGNYEPSNCRWATPLEQGSNKRNNKYCLLDGERMIISEAARRLNVSNKTLAYYKSFPQYNKIPDRIVFE